MKRLLFVIVSIAVLGLCSCNGSKKEENGKIEYAFLDRGGVVHLDKDCPNVFKCNGATPVRMYNRCDFRDLNNEFCTKCVSVSQIHTITNIIEVDRHRTHVYNKFNNAYKGFYSYDDFFRWLENATDEKFLDLYNSYKDVYNEFENVLEMREYLGYPTDSSAYEWYYDIRREFYRQLVYSGCDVGTYDEFSEMMLNNEEDRRWFYNKYKELKFGNLKTYEEFENSYRREHLYLLKGKDPKR